MGQASSLKSIVKEIKTKEASKVAIMHLEPEVLNHHYHHYQNVRNRRPDRNKRLKRMVAAM